MDNYRTLHSTSDNAVVDLAEHWPAELPVNGFEWVKGVEVLAVNVRLPDVFLVKRPGPIRHVPFPDDLYTKVHNLAVTPDAILKLANRYGALRLLGRHFHSLDNMQEHEGEGLSEWIFEVRKFQDTFNLWLCAKDAQRSDVQWVKKYCEPLWKPGSAWPLAWSPSYYSLRNEPLLLAKRVVVSTINQQIAPYLRNRRRCELPGCGFGPDLPDNHSQTRGSLRTSKDGRIQLAVVSSNLLTTAWLQLATYVAGQRKVKKCEAPDCGLYMDVTDSPRPGARRMHPTCEERIRKKRYRENKRNGS